jgi:hypothetical protein
MLLVGFSCSRRLCQTGRHHGGKADDLTGPTTSSHHDSSRAWNETEAFFLSPVRMLQALATFTTTYFTEHQISLSSSTQVSSLALARDSVRGQIYSAHCNLSVPDCLGRSTTYVVTFTNVAILTCANAISTASEPLTSTSALILVLV